LDRGMGNSRQVWVKGRFWVSENLDYQRGGED